MSKTDPHKPSRRGVMLVLAAPSGAGKTTISRAILEADENISLSVSATTRAARPGEEDGVHYFFQDEDTFTSWIREGAFLEWAEVFGRYYGTPAGPVEDALAAGKDVMFDIDWQGAQQLREKRPEDVVSVFILPPSHEALRARLEGRGQDSAEVIQGRMDKANAEMSHWAEFSHVVINEDLETAITQVRAVLEAERVKRSRQVGMVEFVQDLMRD